MQFVESLSEMTYPVVPHLPDKLERLRELAFNLWWTWDREAGDLFRQLAPSLWETTGQNPVLMLGTISQKRLQEVANDKGFLAHMEGVCRRFNEYMRDNQMWYQRAHGAEREMRIAYFSTEFGLTGCLPLYSGGLGVLAGDHLKSAGDLGLPLVGVGLLYQQGYFCQYIKRNGQQGELYPSNDFCNMSIQLQRREDGEPVKIHLAYAGCRVAAQVWRAQIGRVCLFLLDSNLPANCVEDRHTTARLYGGDLDMRLRQEIMLGIGGIRALDSMGILPTVCHMNEGHTAFAALERVRTLMSRYSLSFAEARELVSASGIFTTHTSVPAGIDLFPPRLVEKYFHDYYPLLGLSRDDFLALGRKNPHDESEPFCTAILALRLASQANGVSKLHGGVSRRLWHSIWRGLPEDELPISSVTNGIHLRSWVSGDAIAPLFDRYLGKRWRETPSNSSVWQRVDDIPDEELWQAHEQCRERLVVLARQRLRAQLNRRGASPSKIEMANEVLNPEALTIGFARRFAEYKRPTLILRDPERLQSILTNRDRPAQVIFAGKAHPDDELGKKLIQQIVKFARQEELRRHVVFIEDYDIALAHSLVQGVDVWLNNPRRHQEACGTSGMKAAANGVLNLSVLDGWWPEAYQPDIGWAIDNGEEHEDPKYQDEVESQTIYDLLEKEIIPLFYDRGDDVLPREWIARMKAAMRAICPVFTADRMVREYCERFYIPAAQRYQHLAADGMARGRTLRQRKAKCKSLGRKVGFQRRGQAARRGQG